MATSSFALRPQLQRNRGASLIVDLAELVGTLAPASCDSCEMTRISMDSLKPAQNRYARRVEENGTWTVFDSFTGRVAEVGSRLTTGMQMSEADELMDVLNRIHPSNDNGTVH